MQLEMLGDSAFDQVVTLLHPTDWQAIVAANIGFPITSATLVTYGNIVQAMMDAYTADMKNNTDNQVTMDEIAADIASSTGQTIDIVNKFINEVNKHNASGHWVLAAGVKDPNSTSLPDPSTTLKALENMMIAAAVIVGGYFALQVIGFIPKPRR